MKRLGRIIRWTISLIEMLSEDMKAIFRNLLTDEFINEVAYELPPHAMRDVLRSMDDYEIVKTALRSGIIGQSEVENFVNTLMDKIEPGVQFRYNPALALLAVALEEDRRDFAREFLESLAEVNAAELGMASRVASYCLNLRSEVASNTIGEDIQFGRVSERSLEGQSLRSPSSTSSESNA